MFCDFSPTFVASKSLKLLLQIVCQNMVTTEQQFDIDSFSLICQVFEAIPRE